jgi:hypothetical protein
MIQTVDYQAKRAKRTLQLAVGLSKLGTERKGTDFTQGSFSGRSQKFILVPDENGSENDQRTRKIKPFISPIFERKLSE